MITDLPEAEDAQVRAPVWKAVTVSVVTELVFGAFFVVYRCSYLSAGTIVPAVSSVSVSFRLGVDK